MRNLLALAAMALLVFLGLGWYLNWYKIATTPSADGHRQINIDLNTQKIKEDVNKGKEKVRDLLTTDDNKNNPPAVQPPPLPGTTTSFRPNQDGSFTYPGEGPRPPQGPPSLPMPR